MHSLPCRLSVAENSVRDLCSAPEGRGARDTEQHGERCRWDEEVTLQPITQPRDAARKCKSQAQCLGKKRPQARYSQQQAEVLTPQQEDISQPQSPKRNQVTQSVTCIFLCKILFRCQLFGNRNCEYVTDTLVLPLQTLQ